MDGFEWLSVFMVLNRLNDGWLRRRSCFLFQMLRGGTIGRHGVKPHSGDKWSLALNALSRGMLAVSRLNAGRIQRMPPWRGAFQVRAYLLQYGLLLFPAGGVIPGQNHPECGAFAGTGFQFEAGIQPFAQTFHDGEPDAFAGNFAGRLRI